LTASLEIIMREVTIQRPISIPKLSTALGVEPYQILGQLISRAVFLSPTDTMDDSLARDVATSFGVQLRMIDEDGNT
jgi:hypothetical protein